MKKPLIIFLCLANFHVSAQSDSITMIELENKIIDQSWKIVDLQSQINDLNKRNKTFAGTNTVAGIIYLAGGSLITAYVINRVGANELLLYVGGTMSFIGTLTLFFSPNELQLKRPNKSKRHEAPRNNRNVAPDGRRRK
jgi:hypothetical protein